MRISLLILAAAAVLVSTAVFAGELSRREAARLAAQRAEEATARATGTPAAPSAARTPGAAAPAPALQKPPAVDTKNVTIVSAKDVTLHTAGDLIGKRYALVEIDGAAAPEDAEAFLEWRTGTEMNGKFCNLFRAECAFEDITLSGKELPAKTKMACANETMGKTEERFFAALRLGISFLAVGDSLELRRDDLVLRFALEKEKAESPEEEDKGEEKEAPEAEENPEEDSSKEESFEEESPAADSAAAPENDEPLVSEVAVTEDALLDRKFTLSKVDGEIFTVAMGSQPFIEFGEGMRVGGSACNVFTGLGELRDGLLRVRNAVATRKMCIDPNLSTFERDFHTLLREGAGISLDGPTLVLTGNGKIVEFTEELQ